ncbi:MAG: hypothetical protein ACREJ3_17670, partial [Polyangiaceae bacterium]
MKLIWTFAGCAAVGLAAGPLESVARAHCTDTAAATSKADDVLAAEMNPCGSAARAQNVVTIAEDWDFRLPDDWSDRGANGACRTTTELQKTMNSAML